MYRDNEMYKKGMATRRSVLGDEHGDKAEANKTDFDKDFQDYITNNAWGAVWSRPGLTKRERSLITIALLAALGHEEELDGGDGGRNKGEDHSGVCRKGGTTGVSSDVFVTINSH